MSTPQEAKPQTANPQQPAAKSQSLLLIVVIAILLLQTAGVAFFWHKTVVKAATQPATSGTAVAGAGMAAVQPSAASHEACPREPFPEKEMQRVALDPFLVNLGDSGAEKYLRASVTISVHKDPKAKEEPEEKGAGVTKYAPARDTILNVLGRQDAATLLTADGKAKLKTDILTALATEHPELSVVDVYFTDFLVQS